MDVNKFIKTLTPCLDRHLGEYKLEITADCLPTSVSFLVMAEDFREMSRATRIRFLAEVIEEAFGLPLTFGPMGLAIAPGEEHLLADETSDETDLGALAPNLSASAIEDTRS